MSDEMTQIRVTEEQRDQLNGLKSVGKSYADVLAAEFGIGGESLFAGVEISPEDSKFPSAMDDTVSELSNETVTVVVPPRTFMGYFDSGDGE